MRKTDTDEMWQKVRCGELTAEQFKKQLEILVEKDWAEFRLQIHQLTLQKKFLQEVLVRFSPYKFLVRNSRARMTHEGHAIRFLKCKGLL